MSLTKNKEMDIQFANDLAAIQQVYDPEKAIKIYAAIQAFIRKPEKQKRAIIQAYQKKVQAFGVSTDFDILPRGYFDVTTETDNFDLGWEEAFKLVPKDKNIRTWTIYNVQNGITFSKVPEGGRIQIDKISGTQVQASVDKYGGALGWTYEMITYREVAAMVNQAELFRNKLYTDKANNHYALLAAAAALHVTTYQGAIADGELRRDIRTINEAAYALTNRLKDSGYGDMAQARLLMYANPRDKNRVFAAMNATTAVMAGATRGAEIINYNITPKFTFNANITAGFPILVLPGNQIQRAEDLPPTTFNAPRDVLTLNELTAVWTVYGAIVADDGQCQQINFQ